MARIGVLLGAVAVLLGLAGTARAQSVSQAPSGGVAQAPFVVGIAPHTSARVILEQYQPVRAALAAALGRPVDIITAPDFTEFARRAVDQEYDLAVTTGHQAELFRADAGYLPLVTYTADFLAVLVVAQDSPVHKPRQLDGKVVLGLNPSSLVTLWGLHWLRDNHVAAREVRYISAADSVAQLILSGDAAGGFMSLANFQKLPEEVQARLRVETGSKPMAGRVYMLNGRNAAQRAKILAALREFGASAAGKAYFSENKLGGYRDIGDAELEVMEPFADEVRQVLKGLPR